MIKTTGDIRDKRYASILSSSPMVTWCLVPNAAFFLALLTYIAIAIAVSWLFDFSLYFATYDPRLVVLVPGLLLPILFAACLTSLAIHRPHRPTIHLWEKIRGEWQVPKRLAYGLPIVALAPAFFSVFTSMKISINSIVPFYADNYALWLDVLIHGDDAWKLLHPLVGYPLFTRIIDICYALWFPLNKLVLIYVAFMIHNDGLRSQYLISFVLCWVGLGTLFAIIFSSVGPCFYSEFFRIDRFAPLMSYLQQTNLEYPVWALKAQEYVLYGYRVSTGGVGLGISAIPSVHVGCAVLHALMFSRVNRWAGLAAWAYAGIIMIGSVHLGWHYAVDGYLALILVVSMWKAVGWFFDCKSGLIGPKST